MPHYTGRRKRLGSASGSAEAELPLACTEWRPPRHSGNFSLVMLLKGYFFLSKCVLCRTASPRRCVTPLPSLPSGQQDGAAETPPDGNPAPRGSTNSGQHQQRAVPPAPSPATSAPAADAHPPSETPTPPQLHCTANKPQSRQQGTRKGRPFGTPAPLLRQPKAGQSPSLACGGKGSPRGAGRHREWIWPHLHAQAAQPS